MDTVKKFYEALAGDKAMQERAVKLNEKHKAVAPDEAATAAAIVIFAKSEGYEFNAEELTAYAGKAKKELSDDELQAVAGGTLGKNCFCVLGGVGKDDETGSVCACVVAGGGQSDVDRFGLSCIFGGAVAKL